MDTAPDHDPLRRFLSGKRRSERRACDLPVEVRGAGATFEGRAIDVSEGGVLIWLDDHALAKVHPDMGMLEALGVVDRYFKHGAQVVFAAESVRVPTSVVRLTPPKDRGGVHLGCRFERALTADEASRLLGSEGPPPVEPFALAPKAGPALYLLLFPERSLAAGPRYIARLSGLSDAVIDVRIEPSRPTAADEVGDELTGRPILGRIVREGKPLWEGSLTLVGARAGVSKTPAIDVRLAASATFPRTVLKCFEKRRR